MIAHGRCGRDDGRPCLDKGVSRQCCWLIVVVLMSVSVAACDEGSPSGGDAVAAGEVSLVGEFEWSMPARFGLDGNNNGLIDIPNTVEYILNMQPGTCRTGCGDVVPVFAVVFDGSNLVLVDDAGTPLPIESFTWTLTDDSGVATRVVSESTQTVVEVPEGAYEVALEVASGAHRHVLEESILVRDVVIASIGDSFVAGEGNPEVPGDPARWADAGGSPDLPEDLDHAAAHRSGLAGPAQAALALERADPHTSVTFVFLAASGAEIDNGILGEPDPATGRDGAKRTLRPQVEELSDLMGCGGDGGGGCRRTVDYLVVSAGGNDVGFAFTVGSLIALDPLLVVNPIYQNLLDNLVTDVGDDIDGLPELFGRLADALGGIDIEKVLLAGYPGSSSVARDGRITTCDEIGGDLLPGLEVDRTELEVVREGLLVPLNETLLSIADTHGWSFVDAHVAAFEGHGYCGSDPYGGEGYSGNPFPEEVAAVADPGVRWFRTAEESAVIQGGGGLFQPERLATSGTFHPNELGHRAYGSALVDEIGTK